MERGSAELIAQLRAICGREFVLTEGGELATYQSDGLLHYRQPPLVAVLPADAEEVAAVVRACFEAQVPWVARGSGTGLSGGALPLADGVLIVLARMRRILAIDLPNQRVVVQPGVTNLAVSRAVGPTHFYPPDPSSQIVCSIGGNIAENSGGAHCFKYGFTTNYVLGLQVVLSDGTLVRLRREDPGYDLLGAFVGSEGTLGVSTEITLRVIPAPVSGKKASIVRTCSGAAGEAVSAIVDQGVVPGAIEMMDRLAIKAAEAATGAGYRLDAGAALLVEVDGPREECESVISDLERVCERAGAFEVRLAQTDAERDLIWRARKAAFASMGRIAPAYYVQDGVIPRTRLAEVLRQIDALASEYGLSVANVFHAGDGNLHPLVCYDDAVEGEAARAEELSGKIIQACVDAGGSITGEHGVGVDKREYMRAMFGEADLETFQRLRRAFDPHGLANPGKVMPTPRLCGEVPGPFREHPLERAGIAQRM
jgi:glycolate oxidase